jgi:tryptophan-rich sensory protein
MHSRPWLWPNLLSLDAPIVALLWQLLFVRCFHGSLGMLPAALLAVAVWLIYVADRTLDAWRGSIEQPRHEFYRRHWRAVLPVWIAVLGTGAWLAWSRLPGPLFVEGAAVASGTGLYLAAVHMGLFRRANSKESAVAVLFGLGASLAAWPGVRTTSDVLAILLFTCLCWMNCAAIDDWEHGHELRPSVIAAAGLVALIAAGLLREHRPILGGAETAGALGLVLLDRLRGRYSAEALRVLADVVLLTPIVFLPIVT